MIANLIADYQSKTKGQDEIRGFLKKLFREILVIPDDLEFFEDLTLIQSSMTNLHRYLKRKITKWPIAKIFNKEGKMYHFKTEGFEEDECSSDEECDYFRQTKVVINHTEVKDMSDPIKINELNERLQQKDQMMSEMTIGYLKDIQHLKQMFMRQLTNPEEEIFEVNYYDINQGLDPEVKTYITNKLDDAAVQYKKRLTDFKTRINAIQAESESYQRTIQLFLQKHTLQSLTQLLFAIEKDPYTLWKAFQNIWGNKVFFKVFEQQIGGYGIDYREIDQLLYKSSSAQRIYERHRQALDDELKQVIQESRNEINALHTKISDLESQILILKEESEKALQLCKIQYEEYIEQQYLDQQRLFEIEKNKLLRKTAKDLLKEDQFEMIQRITMKAALSRWHDFAKFWKQYDRESPSQFQLQTRILNHLQSSQVNFIVKDYKKLREKYTQLVIEQTKIDSHEAFHYTLSKQYKEKYESLQIQNELLAQLNYRQKRKLQYFEQSFRVLQKPLYMILNKLNYQIDSKRSLIDIKNINLISGGSEMVQFQEFLDNLPDIQTLVNIYYKGQVALDLFQPRESNISVVQTDIFDINQPLMNMHIEQVIDRIATNQSRGGEVYGSRDFPPPITVSEKLINVQDQKMNETLHIVSEAKEDQEPQMSSKEQPNKEQPELSQSIKIIKPRIEQQIRKPAARSEYSRNSNSTKEKPQSKSKHASPTIQKPQPSKYTSNIDRISQQLSLKMNTKQTQTENLQKTSKAIMTEPMKQQESIITTTLNPVPKSNQHHESFFCTEKRRSLDHQDIIFIMGKKDGSPNRSQSTSRNQSYLVKKKKQPSLLEAARKKAMNVTQVVERSVEEHQHQQPPIKSPRNIFQHYQETYNEKKRLQVANYSYEKYDQGVLQKCIEDKRRREQLPAVYAKPLTTPVLFK